MFRRANDDGEQTDYQNNRVLSHFRRFVLVTKDYHGDHLFVRQTGKRCATPLLAALVDVESSDIIFAVDSVPAVL